MTDSLCSIEGTARSTWVWHIPKHVCGPLRGAKRAGARLCPAGLTVQPSWVPTLEQLAAPGAPPALFTDFCRCDARACLVGWAWTLCSDQHARARRLSLPDLMGVGHGHRQQRQRRVGARCPPPPLHPPRGLLLARREAAHQSEQLLGQLLGVRLGLSITVNPFRQVQGPGALRCVPSLFPLDRAGLHPSVWTTPLSRPVARARCPVARHDHGTALPAHSNAFLFGLNWPQTAGE